MDVPDETPLEKAYFFLPRRYLGTDSFLGRDGSPHPLPPLSKVTLCGLNPCSTVSGRQPPCPPVLTIFLLPLLQNTTKVATAVHRQGENCLLGRELELSKGKGFEMDGATGADP